MNKLIPVSAVYQRGDIVIIKDVLSLIDIVGDKTHSALYWAGKRCVIIDLIGSNHYELKDCDTNKTIPWLWPSECLLPNFLAYNIESGELDKMFDELS